MPDNKHTVRVLTVKNNFNKLLMLFACVVICLQARAQNLVPNPSFELANCPTGYTGAPAQVASFFQNWYAANCASPDPMTNCSTNANTSVPDVWFGNQNARTGTNYIGVSFYNGWYEYIGVQLTQTLTAGDAYQVSFYVSCADQVRYASDALGIYFSTTQIRCLSGFSGPVLSYTPQVVQTPGVFLTDSASWTRVSGTYVATGGEQYIVLGCFKPWNTLALYDIDPSYVNGRCYYYVDDVTVEKMQLLPDERLTFNAEANNGIVELSWHTNREEACFYEPEKSSDAIHFEALTTLGVSPGAGFQKWFYYADSTALNGINYYRLKQTDCYGKNTYTKIISVSCNRQSVRAYPNPVEDELIIELQEGTAYPAKISLYDITGHPVFETETRDAKVIVPCRLYDSGAYTLIIRRNGKDTQYQKIIRQ